MGSVGDKEKLIIFKKEEIRNSRMKEFGYPILSIAILIPFICSFILPVLGERLKNRTLSILSFFLLAVPPSTAFFLLLYYGIPFLDAPIQVSTSIGIFSSEMYLDWLSCIYILGIGVVTPLVALYSRPYMEHRIESLQKEGTEVPSIRVFYLLFIIFSVSMTGFVLSSNLVQIYIFLSLATVASFFLICFYGYHDRFRIGLTFFIWSSLGGLIFLIGLIGLSGSAGTLNIMELQDMNLENLSIWVPLSILLGLLIKKAIFGVHIWLPYAHSEAPTPVSAVLSANMIGISGYAMIRLIFQVFQPQFERMSIFFLGLAYFTMVYAGLMALAQDDFKRMLAYISISQMGWVLFGISTMTTEGVAGGALLFIKHSVSLSILFMCSGVLISRYNGLRNISLMGDLWSKSPLISRLMVLGFITLLGAPLTIGFGAKTLIFIGGTKMFGSGGVAIPILMALSVFVAGGIIAAYTFTALRRMLGGRFKWSKDFSQPQINWTEMKAPIAVIGIIGIILFFFLGPLTGPVDLPVVSLFLLEGVAVLGLYVFMYLVFWRNLLGQPKIYSEVLYHRFENNVVDKFFHKYLVSAFKRTGKFLQNLNTGDLNVYLLWILVVFVGIFLSMFLFL
ncbi:MAG: complex I subunit 5 family protein [Candidatus Hadarchaeota archaeon]